MRLVRSHAGEWGIDTNRIGMVGYSAGGEVVSLTTFGPTDGLTNATNAIDRVSARPDFIAEIYPGPLGVPAVLSTNVPPAFLLCADDDRFHAVVVTDLLEKYRRPKFRRNCISTQKVDTVSTRASARNSRPSRLAATPHRLDGRQQYS